MKNKIFIIIIVIVSMLLYIPVNRLISGGYNLEISIDKNIPLVPIFVIPYLLGLIFWIYSILKINFSNNLVLIKRFNIMIISASIISVLIYILIPTFVTRPEILSTDIFSNILNFVYSNDKVFNAAPSGHTFYTLLCLLGLLNLYSKQKVKNIILSVVSFLIIISTVLTKQHNILDVVIGIIFALGIYLIVTKITNKGHINS